MIFLAEYLLGVILFTGLRRACYCNVHITAEVEALEVTLSNSFLSVLGLFVRLLLFVVFHPRFSLLTYINALSIELW